MDIAGLDLNLLKIFEAMIAEKTTTRAAQRVGLSQPAVSRALMRLRDVFKDDLFVRTAHGLEPTSKALELAAMLQPALDLIRSAVSETVAFDPSDSRRVFSLGMIEYAEASIIDDLVAAINKQAPQVEIRVQALSKLTFIDLLDRGDIDIGLGRLANRPSRINSTVLYRDQLVGLVRDRHHVLTKLPLNLKGFTDLNHLLVSPSGDRNGALDKELAAQGLKRHVQLVLASYLPVAKILRHSDMIASVPERIATRLAALGGLVKIDLPVVNQFDVLSVWHKRNNAEAGHVWFRQVLRETSLIDMQRLRC